MFRSLVPFLSAAVLLGLAPATCLAGNSVDELPELAVTMAPYGTDKVTGIEVRMRIGAPAVAAGDALLRMPTLLVGTPTAAYDASDIHARDEQGKLKLSAVDEEPGISGNYRRYKVDRDTVGDVTVRFATEPRKVDENTRNGPLFDIRPQNGGFMGAGVYFMLLPVDEQQQFDIIVDWDLSKAPDGTQAAWSLGEGRQELRRAAATLAFTFYAVGNIQRADPDPDAAFNMYWISETPFDIERLADNVLKLFTTMAEAFELPDERYRVFIRSNPHRGGGGTGFADSFAFGHGIDYDGPEDGPLMLLSHEIAHNWTRFNAGEKHPMTAWYTEGTAEYYKVVMAHRAGLLDRDRMLAEINSMARGYYGNPYIDRSNEEAGQYFWTDSNAQRVPYGRGFMYLVSVDARIRQATDGEESLHDLILDINRRQRDGEQIGNERWQELLAERIGDRAHDDFEAMVNGEIIVPPDQALAPCYRVYETEIRPFELGFDRMHLGQVTSLLPESAAARAGLKEGDRIVSLTPLDEVRDDEQVKMAITVERDDKQVELRYLPRGEPRPAWLWQNTDAPDSACRF